MKVIRNKEQHLCQELERNNIHFGKGIDLYDVNIKIASVLNEEDLRKVLKVMSENEITVASSEILTYAKLQKHNPEGMKIDIKGAMITAGSVESVTSALVAYEKLQNLNKVSTEVRNEANINKKASDKDRGQVSGNKNNQLNQPKNPKYQKTRNQEIKIDGIKYSGHALDRMQDRGIYPSVVKEAIQYGEKIKLNNVIVKYYDSKNNISIIMNNLGKVVTIRYGK